MEGINTRAGVKGRPCEIGKSTLTQNTCISDAVKMWNKAPITITTCKNVIGVKREIKFFCKNPSNLNNLNNLNNMNNLKIENKKIEKLKNFKNIISKTL